MFLILQPSLENLAFSGMGLADTGTLQLLAVLPRLLKLNILSPLQFSDCGEHRLGL